MNLWRMGVAQLSQGLINAHDQGQGVPLAPATRSPDVQNKLPRVMPRVADWEVRIAAHRAGKVSDEIGCDGIGICSVPSLPARARSPINPYRHVGSGFGALRCAVT